MSQFLSDIAHVLGLLVRLIIEQTAIIADGASERLAIFWRAFKRFLLVAMGLPVVLYIIGIIFRESTFFLVAGLILALSLGLILLAFVPLAALIGAARHKTKETSQKYLNLIAAVIFWALLVTLYTSILPIWNNLKGALTAAIAILVLSFASVVWGHRYITWFRKIAVFLVAVIFIVQTVSLVFPGTTEAIRRALGRAEEEIPGAGEVVEEPPEVIGIAPERDTVIIVQSPPTPPDTLEPASEQVTPAMRYLRDGLAGKISERAILVLAFEASDEGWLEPDPKLRSALETSLRAKGYSPVRDIFKPAFFDDGYPERLMAGDGSLPAGLDLSKYIDYLLVGDGSAELATKQRVLGELTECRVSLRCTLLKTSDGRTQTTTADTQGQGRNEQSAMATAYDKAAAEAILGLLGS